MATREVDSGGKTSSYLVSDVFAKGAASTMVDRVSGLMSCRVAY